MDFTYESYCAYMNSIYLHVYNWPDPYHYHTWYHTIDPTQTHLALHPDYYTQVYTHAMEAFSAQNAKKKVKLSRNQRTKQKKRQLEAELERETKAIGNWVRLQRKDLIEDLQKIKRRQQKMQKKKEKKLSHLIEIHKEVFKHHNKKNNSQHPIKRRVNASKNKKRLSQIKKMKQIFVQSKDRIDMSQKPFAQNESSDEFETIICEDWESDDEQQCVTEQQTNLQQHTNGPQPKNQTICQKAVVVCQKISYKNIGKLTGTLHNNISLREWVTNCPSEPLDDLVLKFVNRLAYKQAIRKVQKQEKAKKIIVSGLKQCKRTLTTIIQKKKARLLVVALNIERNPYKGGVDDQVQNNIEVAQKLSIPILYASTRSNLGRAFTGKWGPRVTMVSIINYEGYQDMYEQMMKEWRAACQKYDQLK